MQAGQSVAYLVNQYPKVSHTFIRREVLALERLGVTVHRYALRGWDAEVTDPADDEERRRTRYVLKDGAIPLAGAVLREAFRTPGRFARASRAMFSLARKADRPWPYHLVYLAEACRLAAWMRASGDCHLHAHFGTNAAEVALLSHLLGGPPYSFTVHGPEEFDRPGPLKLAEKIARSAFVVAISSFGRSQLFRWAAHADWPRVQVVHCGVDPTFGALADQRVAAAHRLVCVGRLCEQKGQLLLVEAVARVRASGTPVQLVLAGDGDMRADIEQRIGALGLHGSVRITGWIGSEQVRDEILAARALVLPSFAEGLPVVVMEAMALGRPVLTTYVAGIPELVRDGIDGWLFPAGDVEALTAAIESCLGATEETVRGMGEQARSRVLERHDVDVEAAKLARLFDASVAHGLG